MRSSKGKIQENQVFDKKSQKRHPKKGLACSDTRKYNFGKKYKKRKMMKARQVWSSIEEMKYVRFLADKGFLFGLSVQERRKAKLNLQMSLAIQTRTSRQCHSHHQKMIKRYNSIQEIIGAKESLFQAQSANAQKEQQNCELKKQFLQYHLKNQHEEVGQPSVKKKAGEIKLQNQHPQSKILQAQVEVYKTSLSEQKIKVEQPQNKIKSAQNLFLTNHSRAYQEELIQKYQRRCIIKADRTKTQDILKEQLDSEEIYIRYYPRYNPSGQFFR